jgi:hypothetical protein
MNRKELKNIFDKEKISPRVYSLYGPVGDDNRYVLEERFGTWFVYYSERGERFGEQIFISEDEACKYMLQKILKDPTTKLVK